MHITDDLDRDKTIKPTIDTEVDLDAPYIDFDYAENKEEIVVPENGIWDTLFYEKTKIFIVNEVSETEVRFYTSETPNEKYRAGQKHVKGKVIDIKKIKSSEENAGFIVYFDSSKKYNGKLKTIAVDRDYVKATQTRCIAIIYFDEEGWPTGEELIIPIDDWFSPKVYLNQALIVTQPEEYPFQIGDIVDVEYYVKVITDKERNQFKIEKRANTGRLANLQLLKREWEEYDENGLPIEKEVYYYAVTIDISKEYEFYQFTIASTVIYKMIIHDDNA